MTRLGSGQPGGDLFQGRRRAASSTRVEGLLHLQPISFPLIQCESKSSSPAADLWENSAVTQEVIITPLKETTDLESNLRLFHQVRKHPLVANSSADACILCRRGLEHNLQSLAPVVSFCVVHPLDTEATRQVQC